MTAFQLIPKSEARPGDRVREEGSAVPFDQMPRVVRVQAEGLIVMAPPGPERFMPLTRIEQVVRPVLGNELVMHTVLPLPVQDDEPAPAGDILAKFLKAPEELRAAGAPASEIAGAQALARVAARVLARN